jgi:hypothetical protein
VFFARRLVHWRTETRNAQSIYLFRGCTREVVMEWHARRQELARCLESVPPAPEPSYYDANQGNGDPHDDDGFEELLPQELTPQSGQHDLEDLIKATEEIGKKTNAAAHPHDTDDSEIPF